MARKSYSINLKFVSCQSKFRAPGVNFSMDSWDVMYSYERKTLKLIDEGVGFDWLIETARRTDCCRFDNMYKRIYEKTS